jgi:hypothetical protein
MTTLELELVELKTRVERLETKVRRLAGDRHEVAPPAPGQPLDQEQLIAWLKAEGLVRDPTLEERELAAEWDAIPEEEKEAVRWELDHLPPGPMASDIIIENRR